MALQHIVPSGFFVVEAKLNQIWEHIPQAVGEIYACGRVLE
jgi:hypothetical protein